MLMGLSTQTLILKNGVSAKSILSKVPEDSIPEVHDPPGCVN